jgi:cellulose synthase/poly-beta-1,6-N-acetylglucosamine synthase-like glycosyltransferase
MTFLATLLALAYQVAGLLLTLYACFLFSAVILFFLSRRRHDWPAAAPSPTAWPSVTVQLPIFNEPAVARRVVEAAAALDYPPDRLQIQVLDDSTDRTAALLPGWVARLRRQTGLNIAYHHRRQRQGYKAGALAAGLAQADGEFIAVFDADYAPPADWLRRTVPALLAHPQLAFVQTRWGYLNRSQNALTAAQALALDGHFVVEQQARSAAGLWQNFNGSGGLWRRSAIESAGGWTADTVTEDFDLSYRAQLQGWRGGYIDAIAAPGEVPPTLGGYKRQQRRWAKGACQTLRKLAPDLWRSQAPAWRRLYAGLHMAGYTTHLLLLLLLWLSLPLALLPDHPWPLPIPGGLSLAVSVLPILLYALSQQRLAGWRGLGRLWALPILALINLGFAPTLAAAVIEGFRRRGGVFERTPKHGSAPQWGAIERGPWRQLLPETLACLLAGLTLAAIAANGRWGLAPLPLFFLFGAGLVLSLGLREQLRAAPRPAGRRQTLAEAITPSDF